MCAMALIKNAYWSDPYIVKKKFCLKELFIEMKIMGLIFCPSLLNKKSEYGQMRKGPLEVILSKTLISLK